MPASKTATRPGIAEWKAAVDKAAALEAEEAQITANIGEEVVVGNDISALQQRRAALRLTIETAHETVRHLRPFAAVEEQAALRRDVEAARQVRVQNQQNAVAAQKRYDELDRQLSEAAREVQHWRYGAPDGVYTTTNNLERHIAEHGDLSGDIQ